MEYSLIRSSQRYLILTEIFQNILIFQAIFMNHKNKYSLQRALNSTQGGEKRPQKQDSITETMSSFPLLEFLLPQRKRICVSSSVLLHLLPTVVPLCRELSSLKASTNRHLWQNPNWLSLASCCIFCLQPGTVNSKQHGWERKLTHLHWGTTSTSTEKSHLQCYTDTTHLSDFIL